MAVSSPTVDPIGKRPGALKFFGFFSILIGFFAIAFPWTASLAIEQVIGVVLVISGVFSIGTALSGGEKTHRVSTIILALIRLAAGLALLVYLKQGVITLTVVLCVFFLAEGFTFILSSLALRHNRAWPLILVNGLVAILLGAMIFYSLPASAAWAIGLLYGINSIFYGITLLSFAAAQRGNT
jgi:uncharacterized membrane protein HdeD (DUF308 family)